MLIVGPKLKSKSTLKLNQPNWLSGQNQLLVKVDCQVKVDFPIKANSQVKYDSQVGSTPKLMANHNSKAT